MFEYNRNVLKILVQYTLGMIQVNIYNLASFRNILKDLKIFLKFFTIFRILSKKYFEINNLRTIAKYFANYRKTPDTRPPKIVDPLCIIPGSIMRVEILVECKRPGYTIRKQ